MIERIVREEGLTVLGWRDTPINAIAIGRVARGSQPYIQQVFVARARGMNEDSTGAQAVRRAQARRNRSRRFDIGQGLLLHPLAVRAAPSYIKDCCWRRRSPTSIPN